MTNCFEPKFGPKVQKLPKIHIWRTTGRRQFVDFLKWLQDMIYYGYSIIRIPSDNHKGPKYAFVCTLEPLNDRIVWFSVSRQPPVYKLVDPSKRPQELIYSGSSKKCILLRQPERPKNAFFCFLNFIWWNFKSFHITRSIYHINLLTFQNDQKTLLFTRVWHNICINDQRNWAKIRTSCLLENDNFRISLKTYFNIIYIRIEKNQGKTNVCFAGTNFRMDLHLAVSLRII